MSIRIDDFGRSHRGAWRSIVRSTITLAFAAAAALVASGTNADAKAREIDSAWSYGFDDSLWSNNGGQRPKTHSAFAGDGALRCFANCGPAFGRYVLRRSELLSSNTADISVNKAADATGHVMALSGMIVIERLEADGLGADWVVVGERTLDSNGTHSWSLLSDVSRDAPWFPTNLYQFDGSSVSVNFVAGQAAGPGATPEASTWAMMLIGFLGLSVAACRSSRNHQRSINI